MYEGSLLLRAQRGRHAKSNEEYGVPCHNPGALESSEGRVPASRAKPHPKGWQVLTGCLTRFGKDAGSAQSAAGACIATLGWCASEYRRHRIRGVFYIACSLAMPTPAKPVGRKQRVSVAAVLKLVPIWSWTLFVAAMPASPWSR